MWHLYQSQSVSASLPLDLVQSPHGLPSFSSPIYQNHKTFGNAFLAGYTESTNVQHFPSFVLLFSSQHY
jgi:hypothetical protein